MNRANNLGLRGWILFGIISVLSVIILPILIPMEIWIRYKEYRKTKNLLYKD